jgi:hypothetical protein
VKDKQSYTIEYEAAGLVFEFTPASGSKGDLVVIADEQPVVGKVDLNSPKSRTTFVKEAYELYPDNFTLPELDFRRALNDLATHVDEELKIRAAKAEEEIEEENEDEVEVNEDEAEALIEAPNVLDRFVEKMAEIFDVYGDRAQMKVVTLGALSAQLKPLLGGTPVGTNVMLIGEAGRGKNFVSDAVAAGMPRTFVYEFESASAKSFFYNADANPDRFKHTWVYPNEAEATDALIETLRPMLSKAKATHNTVDTNAEGSNAFRELTIEGPITVTIPTVRNKLDNQFQSRMLVIELEEFEDRVPKHSAKVSESLLLTRAAENHEGELNLWRAALQKLTEVRRVGTTYQHEKFRLSTNKISHGARLWRNFLSLMLTHAWLEQRNRKTIELENGERAIAVASADYRAAYEVFSDACKRSVVELSDTHRKILNAVYALQHDEKRGKLRNAGFSFRKIGEEAGISHETVRKQRAFLVSSVGLLRDHEEGGLSLVKDAEPSWWEDYEILEGFPKPDEVATWWKGEKAVDTVDTPSKSGELSIDKANSKVDTNVDMSTREGVDATTEVSTPKKSDEPDESVIDKPNPNGHVKVSTVSTLFEGPQVKLNGGDLEYEYSEDE